MLPVEVRAVLACARAVVDPGRLAEVCEAISKCPSADSLAEIAAHHGMLGHLHQAVLECAKVPEGLAQPEFAGRLGKVQRASAVRSLGATAKLLALLRRLRESGIDVIPFKGPTLAEQVYGDVTLRSWVDLDLLVPYRQMATTRRILLEEGYQDIGPHNVRLMSKARGGWGEIALTSGDRSALVDLHWEVGVHFSRHSLKAEDILQHSQASLLLEQKVIGLSPEDLLLTSLLRGARDRWSVIEGLLAAGMQVRTLPEGDWPGLLDRARRVGCLRRAVVGVAHVCRVLRIDAPPEVLAVLSRDAVARRLVRSLGPETLEFERSPGDSLAKIGWNITSEDTLGAIGRHAVDRFTRPGPEDWDCFSLPAWLEWLYYPLRPIRLMVKWTARLLRFPGKGAQTSV